MKEKLAEWINVIYGFRKLLLVLILYVVGIIFRVKGYVDGGQMVDLFKSITVAFMTANVGEHITTTIKQWVDSKGKKQINALPGVVEGGPATGDGIPDDDSQVEK